MNSVEYLLSLLILYKCGKFLNKEDREIIIELIKEYREKFREELYVPHLPERSPYE